MESAMKLIASAIIAFFALTTGALACGADCCKCCDKPATEQSQPHH
jgi:hypothetical protein